MYRSSPGHSPTTPSRFAPRPPITSRHSTPSPNAPPSDKSYGGQKQQQWEGRSWEHGAGAPKPLTREPDYEAASQRGFGPLPVQPNRRKAETLPAPALGEALVQHARSETCDPKILQNRLPPIPASTRHSRTQSQHANTGKRPTHSRRHTSDAQDFTFESQMSPESIPHHIRRDVAFDHDSRSPTSHKPPHSTAESGLSHDRSRSLTKVGLGETSPYVKLTTTRRARHSLQSTAPTRTPSTVLDKSSSRVGNRSRLMSAPQPSPLSPKFDKTSPTATSSQSSIPPSLVADHPAYDMSSVSSALPMPETPRHHPLGSPFIPRQAPASLRTPLNLGHRTRDDEVGYDPYTMHPAAATPPRADREAVKDTMVPVTGLAPPAPEGKYPNGVYFPPGYAKPTKNLEWNRDGPAMRTHGVAWKRHNDELVLPDRPKGPRWLQARPPRTTVVTGGGWEQSGGNH